MAFIDGDQALLEAGAVILGINSRHSVWILRLIRIALFWDSNFCVLLERLYTWMYVLLTDKA
uniref:Uncharacterized protein n=1 Tax=Arundo donax TaxID=35708 RepID=A0A0A9D491_ARUDO